MQRQECPFSSSVSKFLILIVLIALIVVEVKKIFKEGAIHVVCEGRQLLWYKKTAQTLHYNTRDSSWCPNPRIVFTSFKCLREILTFHKTSLCVQVMVRGLELNFSRCNSWFFNLDLWESYLALYFPQKIITFISVLNKKKYWSNMEQC